MFPVIVACHSVFNFIKMMEVKNLKGACYVIISICVYR